MSDGTSIEWCDATWQPVVGCTRVSAGCDNCYAATFVHRGLHETHRGLTKVRPKDSARPGVDWNGEVRLLPERLADPLKWKMPRRVFVGSMTDLFHPSIPFEYVAAVFGLMAACPQHTFLVLTKRPERAREFFAWAERHPHGDGSGDIGGPSAALWKALSEHPGPLPGLEADDEGVTLGRALDRPWPLPNVHLGTSVEDQTTADERIPALLQCPAALHWLSIEPQLGEVDLSRWIGHVEVCNSCGSERRGIIGSPDRCDECGVGGTMLSLWGAAQIEAWRAGRREPDEPLGDGPPIGWVVDGGESGPGARPFDVEWARSIVGQCRAAGVPVFVKQLGARPYDDVVTIYGDKQRVTPLRNRKGGDMSEWPADLRCRESPEVRRA